MNFRSAIVIAAGMVLMSCGFEPVDDGRPKRVIQDEEGVSLTFGAIDQVEGTRFFIVPIVLGNGPSGSGGYSSSYDPDHERNRLIVDSLTGDSRRVLPDDKFQIVNWIEPDAEMGEIDRRRFVESNARQPGATKPSGLYAAVVKRPGQRENDDDDRYDVLVGRFETGQQAWIARDLRGVQGIWMTADGKLALVGAAGNRGVYRLYDPTSFRQMLEKDLSL